VTKVRKWTTLVCDARWLRDHVMQLITYWNQSIFTHIRLHFCPILMTRGMW